MRSRTSTSRGFSPLLALLVVVLVLTLGAAGTAAALVASGTIDLASLPWFKKVVRDPNEGKVAVIVSGRPVAMYSKVTAEHVTNPANQQYSIMYFEPHQVQPDWLRDYGQILGRVVRHDKAAGKVFTEREFFPLGTAAGRVAGIPPGMAGMTVDASKIQGLTQLNTHDRFDLVVSMPAPSSTPERMRTSTGSQPARSPRPTGAPDSAGEVKLLVSNGFVVQANVEGGHAMIAVAPEDSLPLTQALTAGSSIVCVARSGQPGDHTADRTPPREAPPQPKVVWIETIRNRDISMEVFVTPAQPSTDESRRVARQ